MELRILPQDLAGWDDPRARLRAALEQDRFVLLQQRIFPLHAGVEAGPFYELFLRLQEEEDRRLPPGSFFPFAERFGLMAEIDRWVARTLIARCGERRRDQPGWRTPVYWLNLSRAALQSAEFVRSLQRQIEREAFDGHRLCFEIPEELAAAEQRDLRRFVDALRPLGCRIAIDGYRGEPLTLAAVRELAVDFLKIDGSIVRALLHDARALEQAHAILAKAREAGARTVAMLVEDPAVLTAVRRMGIDYAQGFGLARPEPLFEGK